MFKIYVQKLIIFRMYGNDILTLNFESLYSHNLLNLNLNDNFLKWQEQLDVQIKSRSSSLSSHFVHINFDVPPLRYSFQK